MSIGTGGIGSKGIGLSASTPTIYNESFTETLTATDSLANSVTFANILTESITSSDALTNTAIFSNAISASLTATYGLSNKVTFSNSLTVSLTATDSLTNTAIFNSSITSSLTATDALSNAVTFLNAITESLTAADSLAVSGNAIYNEAITEAISALDSISVSGTTQNQPLGGGVYVLPYHRIRDKEQELDRKLAQAEREAEQTREALALEQHRKNENLARNLEAQAALHREEINRLLIMKAAMIRQIDDEEAALVLLLSMPFVH